jgi:hypothetical protein
MDRVQKSTKLYSFIFQISLECGNVTIMAPVREILQNGAYYSEHLMKLRSAVLMNGVATRIVVSIKHNEFLINFD